VCPKKLCQHRQVLLTRSRLSRSQGVPNSLPSCRYGLQCVGLCLHILSANTFCLHAHFVFVQARAKALCSRFSAAMTGLWYSFRARTLTQSTASYCWATCDVQISEDTQRCVTFLLSNPLYDGTSLAPLLLDLVPATGDVGKQLPEPNACVIVITLVLSFPICCHILQAWHQ